MEILTLEIYERGSYSPSYGDEKEAMPGIEILDEAEDFEKRTEMMKKAENNSSASASSDLSVVFHFLNSCQFMICYLLSFVSTQM